MKTYKYEMCLTGVFCSDRKSVLLIVFFILTTLMIAIIIIIIIFLQVLFELSPKQKMFIPANQYNSKFIGTLKFTFLFQ